MKNMLAKSRSFWDADSDNDFHLMACTDFIQPLTLPSSCGKTANAAAIKKDCVLDRVPPLKVYMTKSTVLHYGVPIGPFDPFLRCHKNLKSFSRHKIAKFTQKIPNYLRDG